MQDDKLAKNAVEEMSPWFFLARNVGVCPYKVSLDQTGSYQLNFKYYDALRSLIVLAALFYIFLLYFPSVNDSSLNIVVTAADYLISTLLTTCIILGYAFITKKSFSVLNSMVYVDQVFETLQVHFFYEREKKRMVVRLVVWTVCQLALCAIYTTLFSLEDGYPLLLAISGNVWNGLKITLIVKSYQIIRTLRSRFEAINEKLLLYARKWPIVNVTEKTVSDEDPFLTFHKLRIIHDKLCDFCDYLNETETLPAIFGVCLFFTISLSNIFYWYSHWYNVGTQTALRLIHTVVLVSNHFFDAFLVVMTMAGTSKEANRTAVLVHKIFGEIRDPDVVEELQLFSSQLLHRRVQFTGWGLFPMDYTLIFSSVSTLTAYLVILIQFQNLSPPNSTGPAGFHLS